MKYYTRRATAFDFHVVFSGLSEVSAFEFCRDGVSWWKAMRACLDLHALCPAEAVVHVDAKGHDETIAPIGTNITHGCVANVQYINRKFVNMYLCSNGLPIDHAKSADLFKGYGGLTTEFENRDN